MYDTAGPGFQVPDEKLPFMKKLWRNKCKLSLIESESRNEITRVICLITRTAKFASCTSMW